MRAMLVSMLLFACIAPAYAQQQVDREQLRAGVWERILARLEALPERWDALPAPAVPPSGRSAEEVLVAATPIETLFPLILISRLALSAPEARAQLIAKERQQRALSEVDLWCPWLLAEREQFGEIDQAGLTMDAWLELAERLGRRDVLLSAAGVTLNLAQLRVPPARLLAAARRWSSLPPGPHGIRGAAAVNQAYGSILFRTDHRREALDAYAAATLLFFSVGDKLGEGYSWRGQAAVLFHLGQNQAALDAYRRARSLFQDAGDELGQGGSWDGEADVLFHLGQNQAALKAYHQARALFQHVGDKLGQGSSWVGEAAVLFHLGQNQEALDAYRQGRSLLQDMGNKQGQGNSWVGEAAVLFHLGRYQGALDAYHQARALFQHVGDKVGEGSSWIGEAEVLFRLGQNQGALDAYHQARALFQRVGDPLGRGNAWRGEAEVLFRLGQNQRALDAYRQARALFQHVDDKKGQGNSWFGEAMVLFQSGQDQGALNAHRQARALYEDVGYKTGQGNTWVGEAITLYRLGQYEEALNAYRQARAQYQDVDDKLGQGASWQGETDVLLHLNELEPALRAAENAARLARDMGSLPNELIARTREAQILLTARQEPRAIQRAKDARVLLRQWRQKGASDLDRTAMANWSWPDDLLVPLLARKRGPAVEEALALAEEAHAPVLLDLLVTGIRRPDNTNDVSLLEERKRLQHERAVLDRRVQDTIAPGQREKLRHEREVVDDQLEINELRALGSLDSAFLKGEPIDTKARAPLVREAGPILFYYVAGKETVAFFLEPGQRAPLVRHIALSRDQLQDEVRTLRRELANPLWEARAHARQRALFNHLVAPFAELLTATPRVTIIPHGPLHELPFEALLVDDRTALFERWHVSIAPSLSALHMVRQRRDKRKPAPDDIAFVGLGGGTGLSLSGPAVEDVGTGFGAAARLIPPGPGSHRAYLEHAPRARHLLVVTHGTHVAQSRSGYLELTAPEGHLTRLTASEIAQNPLRAELVTLAACETARGEAMQSDERLDLTRAFLIAGAGAVLATRWRVPATEETRLFLIDFYQALRQGGPGGTPMHKDEALTETRRRSRQRGDHAQLWAAWVLVGDAR
jgi:CHAT domain-containing protein/tetratricopeptide (TPR) repeat protein